MPFLTILTPTYNRGYILHKVFESLKNQTNQDFIWLIVDDGSTDDTKELASKFKADSPFEIRYIYKENGGKHTALRMGINIIDSELTAFLDSDDIFTHDAVETIAERWNDCRKHPNIASVDFLKVYPDGSIIGDLYPKDGYISNFIECRFNKNIKGDKAAAYRTDILKQFPFPDIKGVFIPEGIVWGKIGDKYDSIYYNKSICICEYREDGITKNVRKQILQKKSTGIMMASNSYLCFKRKLHLKRKFKIVVFWGACGLAAKIKIRDLLKESNAPVLQFFCLPVSYVRYLLWKIRA